MRLHAVLFSAAILTASAAAQSAPHDSRLQLPAFARKSPQLATRAAASSSKSVQSPTILGPSNSPRVARNTTCFAIRSYNFPTDPASDITKPANITTCEPARNNSIKSAAVVLAR